MPAVGLVKQLPVSRSDSELIADRYRVEGVLGQGGMGEVLAVVEEATGERFALKRLLASAKPKHALLLQREYHTLFSLKHPHVVRAFDYGTDYGVPYYTMELLSGRDVEALAPLPWREVVPLLRDVASALSLLHARSLLHRDVSARNVWRTPDGKVKLIDFGTLASFGEVSDIAGTPPYLAPEALRSRVLDQRTDLYALGALAYFLLTGRHAFAARSLSELEQHWEAGFAAPSSVLARLDRADLGELPERLEQLIEALLSPEPQGRPANAVEVLDRLALVLPAASELEDGAVEGLLASKAFVGRENEKRRLAALIKRNNEICGGAVVLYGARGIGRTRLLSEFAVAARVAGAAVLLISGERDAKALSAAARAVLKLFESAPTLVRALAAPHAKVLGHLSPELRLALEISEDALERFPKIAGEARARIQSSLRELWLAVCAEKPTVLLLDDLQEMDEVSLALFATLAQDSVHTKLLVVAAVRSEDDEKLPPYVEPFAERAAVFALQCLSPAECQSMLQSIFGDAEHVPRVAQALARRAEGNPGSLMELCAFLLQSGVVRFNEGGWVLPRELPDSALPSSLAVLEETRLAQLSANAKLLARILSVVVGNVPLELCAALSPLPSQAMFVALFELSASGVLLSVEGGYRFRREPMRVRLYASLDAAEARAAHAAAGQALLEGKRLLPLVDQMVAGVHILRGGRSLEGLRVVARAANDCFDAMPEERAETARALEECVPALDQHRLSDPQRLSILCALALLGFLFDRRLAHQYGAEALACAERVCGMTLARRLSPYLGAKLALYIALIVAALRLRRAARKSDMVPSFAVALRMLTTAAGALAGTFALCIAREKVLASVRAVEPLRALGEDHAGSIVYQFGLGVAGTVGSHLEETDRVWRRLMKRLDDPRPIKGLDEVYRSYYSAASLYGWGVCESWRDNSQALAIADRLASQPLLLYQVSADQVRAVYYAHQGSMREAARCKARVESRALQHGMVWQSELWEPGAAAVIGVRHHDAMIVKRAQAQLAQLAAETPSLQRYAASAHVSYLLLRGRYGEALPLSKELAESWPEASTGYALCSAQLAKAHRGVGELPEARAAYELALAHLKPGDLLYTGATLELQTEASLVDAMLGDDARAVSRLDDLIALHTPSQAPLTLGSLHEARARVALQAQRQTEARQHFDIMESWYRKTDVPALLQHCDQLMRRFNKRTPSAAGAPFIGSATFLGNVSSHLITSLVIDAPEELLRHIVRGAMATEGALVMAPGEGLMNEGSMRTVQSRSGALPDGLLAWAEERMRETLSYTTRTEDTDEAAPEDPNAALFEGKRWRLSILTRDDTSGMRVVGAVALCTPVAEIPLDVLRALAEHFDAHGALMAQP